MSKTKELIDLLKFRATGVGQAPDYSYQNFYQEVQFILNDPKWLEQSPQGNILKPGDLKIGDIVQVIENTNFSKNQIGDYGVVKDIISDTQYRISVEGREQISNWHPLYELKKVNNLNK